MAGAGAVLSRDRSRAPWSLRAVFGVDVLWAAMSICSACAHPNPRGSTRCDRCGAALGRGDEAAALRIAVKRAKAAMLLVVTVQVLGVVYLRLTEGLDAAMMVAMLGFAAVYVGLYAWCPHRPLAASLSGLVVFVVVHAVEAVLDPAALARGLVIIVGVVLTLAWAVAGGLAHRTIARGVDSQGGATRG